MTDGSSYDPSSNGYDSAEDNRPLGWSSTVWTEAPTPSGHARVYLLHANVYDFPDGSSSTAARVL